MSRRHRIFEASARVLVLCFTHAAPNVFVELIYTARLRRVSSEKARQVSVLEVLEIHAIAFLSESIHHGVA